MDTVSYDIFSGLVKYHCHMEDECNCSSSVISGEELCLLISYFRCR